jgi:hypothetical protein
MAKDALSEKITRLDRKLHKQMAKANKTREKLEKARRQDIERADGSLSNSTPS